MSAYCTADRNLSVIAGILCRVMRRAMTNSYQLLCKAVAVLSRIMTHVVYAEDVYNKVSRADSGRLQLYCTTPMSPLSAVRTTLQTNAAAHEHRAN